MVIIDAHWDQEITGHKTCEVIFEQDDEYEDYLKAKIEENFEFSVVKIPVGNLKLVHQLEDSGYRYLENQLAISLKAEQLENINKSWLRLLEGFSYKPVRTEADLLSITEQVEGNMFEADRYSQDPFWEEGISSKRYVSWIQNLFKTGEAQFYIMVKSGREVGFFSIKNETSKKNSCPIAGIYNKHKFSGYIFVLVWYILEISRLKGAIQFDSTISSNNINILSSFSKAFSFRVNSAHIVLRKVIL